MRLLPYWVVVEGESMSPEYRPGDLLLVLPLASRPKPIALLLRTLVLRRGMVVVVRPPAHLGRSELKRIRSVGGDLETWGVAASRRHECVPRGCVFVVGATPDGALAPADSRSYGPLPLVSVVGYVLRRLRPPP